MAMLGCLVDTFFFNFQLIMELGGNVNTFIHEHKSELKTMELAGHGGAHL